MRIIVDARKAADYGIGTYIRQLGAACARLAPEDEFVFLGGVAAEEGGEAPGGREVEGGREVDDGREPAETDRDREAEETDNDAEPLSGPNIRWEPNPSANYGVTELFSVSLQVRKLHGDVFHAPHYIYPVMLPCPGVVTVHDCIHLRFPGQLPNPAAALYAKVMMRRAVRAADRVLVGSEATRADLIELVEADPTKIEVIPHGCDPFFLAAVDEEELAGIRRQLGLERRFLLSASNIKPHKNLKRLLQAFGQLQGDYPDLDLVVAGGDFSEHPELQALCAEQGIEDRVRSLGFLPKRELRGLYHLAEVFVFPSLYEGFGLPPLEAMACGTAVVASRSSAIPEVVGHSGLLVNPFRVQAIAEAVRSLLENDTLRAALGAQGRAQAREFDWNESARRVLEVYRRVASP
jgi:glycosyltransferase involved in cell wall biosynthesis